MLGIVYYIPFITRSISLLHASGTIPGRQPIKNCLVVYCALAIFLFLEAFLRMGSLILYLSQHHVLLHHRALAAEDHLKPYQIMFGRSASVIFLM